MMFDSSRSNVFPSLLRNSLLNNKIEEFECGGDKIFSIIVEQNTMSQSQTDSKAEQKRLNPLTDEELMLEFQNGSTGAFTLLMRRYKDQVVNYAFRFLGNYDDAIDVGQEVFVRVYKYKNNFGHTIKFTTWLYTITANLSKTELKRYWRRNSVSLEQSGNPDSDDHAWDIPDNDYLPDERADQSEIAKRVQIALMKVSPTNRELIVLRDLQDCSYEQIAEITSLELGTVKSRINRGRKQLQEHLRDIYNDYFQIVTKQDNES